MADKQKDFTMTVLGSSLRIQAHIDETGLETQDTTRVTVRVKNDLGATMPACPVEVTKDSGNAAVSVTGGIADLGPIEDGEIAEGDWLVSNNGAGAANNPSFVVRIDVNAFNVGIPPFLQTFKVPVP